MDWYGDQYTKNDVAALPWADQCLIVMQEVEKEMQLDSLPSFEAAKSVFKPERVIEAPPEPPKKKSMFDRLKER